MEKIGFKYSNKDLIILWCLRYILKVIKSLICKQNRQVLLWINIITDNTMQFQTH
jgi:hypothetical protein